MKKLFSALVASVVSFGAVAQESQTWSETNKQSGAAYEAKEFEDAARRMLKKLREKEAE